MTADEARKIRDSRQDIQPWVWHLQIKQAIELAASQGKSHARIRIPKVFDTSVVIDTIQEYREKGFGACCTTSDGGFGEYELMVNWTG